MVDNSKKELKSFDLMDGKAEKKKEMKSFDLMDEKAKAETEEDEVSEEVSGNENEASENETNENEAGENEGKSEEKSASGERVWDPEKKSSRGGFFLILLVIIISVVMTTIMMKNNGDNGQGNDDPSVVNVKDNTELKSGTVSVTIDGKEIVYKGAYVVDGTSAEIYSGTFESKNDDEAVFLVINGGALKIDGDVTIHKTGSADFSGRGDEYSFYGINSAIVVVGAESSASIKGAKITTEVSGANAVVATNGGGVLIEESTINTTKDNSRGLHATYKGRINADEVEIKTLGGSSATLATDRGEGTVVANDVKLSTAGAGSPLIYSTGSITVTNSEGTATGAQIAVVEGKNSINLEGCDFAANGNGNRGSVDNAGVMIYQSMSGDASVGMGSFTATDCDLRILTSSSVYSSAPFFFVTNTNATIDITDTEISFSPSQKFISAQGTDEWGVSGYNGGNVTVSISGLEATNTEVEVDEISNIELKD